MKLHCASLIAICLLLGGCHGSVVRGHGAVTTETRPLPAAFDKIEISAPVDAQISVGGAPALRFEGFANLMPYLRTEVRNGTLRIFTDDNTALRIDRNIVARISVPSLTGLELNGASDATVSGAVNAPAFGLDVSGASSVNVQELHVQTFKADMSGSATLTLGRGEINDGSFDVSGSGKIKAFGVTQQQVSLDLNGAAEAEVKAMDKLDVDISGAGSVSYKGHPGITKDISGAGAIRDAN